MIFQKNVSQAGEKLPTLKFDTKLLWDARFPLHPALATGALNFVQGKRDFSKYAFKKLGEKSGLSQKFLLQLPALAGLPSAISAQLATSMASPHIQFLTKIAEPISSSTT